MKAPSITSPKKQIPSSSLNDQSYATIRIPVKLPTSSPHLVTSLWSCGSMNRMKAASNYSDF
jgi:hypothetical protein